MLGEVITNDRSVTTPTNVSGLTSGVRGVAMGWFHTCALLENGSIQCWGDNWNGQLGNGVAPASSTPLTVVLGPRQQETEEGGYREPVYWYLKSPPTFLPHWMSPPSQV